MLKFLVLGFCCIVLGLAPASRSIVQSSAHAAVDSTLINAKLEFSISEFEAEWQVLWRRSEDVRTPGDPRARAGSVGAMLMHCHRPESSGRGGRAISESFSWREKQYVPVGSTVSAFSVCPSWLLTDFIALAQDETDWIDGALLPEFRNRIFAARARLLALLDSAAQERPQDGWISGQRVRFATDQRDFDRAIKLAESCRGGLPWWCDALRGYAHIRSGSFQRATLEFATMRSHMTEVELCKWDDMRLLLPFEQRASYTLLNCEEQLRVNRTLWWLADPLFRVAGNERYTEEDRRRVEVALRRATAQDERHHWDAENGSDALFELALRYGNPTYQRWGGPTLDIGHTSYLRLHNSLPSVPYTTFEYTVGRISTIPAWKTALKPFEVTDSTWQLSMQDSLDRNVLEWWPVEHFRPSRRLIELEGGQSVTLRRQTQNLYAVAVNLEHGSVVPAKSNFDVLMLGTTDDQHIDSLEHLTATGNSTVAMRAMLPAVNRIIAVEAMGVNSTVIDLRSRFGVMALPTLSAIHAGELAVSMPVLLEAGKPGDRPPVPEEEQLNHMLGALRLKRTARRVAVYWESYGLKATDTVSVSIRLSQDAAISSARKFGMLLKVADNPNQSITQKWTEPSSLHATNTLDGPVPVQIRLLTLDLSHLEAGPYALEVRMTKLNGVFATSVLRHIVLE